MTTADYWEKVTAFAKTASDEVGAHLMSAFGTATAEQKADGSLVTKYDKWADQELRDRIAATFPDHGVLTEEAEHIFPSTDWCWVIDPIDGTTNFTRGVPLWGVSLGLLIQRHSCFWPCIHAANCSALSWIFPRHIWVGDAHRRVCK